MDDLYIMLDHKFNLLLYHTQIFCYTISSLCTSTLSYSQDQDGEREPRFSSGANETEGSRTTCDSTGEYQVRESGKLGGKEGREEEVGEKGGCGGRSIEEKQVVGTKRQRN